MGKLICIANQKGGVAKTTTTRNLATCLVKKLGYKVLAVDYDPQGDLSSLFTYPEEEMQKTNSLPDLMKLEVLNQGSNDATIEKFQYDTHDAIRKSNDGVDVLYTKKNDKTFASLINALPKIDARKASFIFKSIIEQVKDEYDYIIMDTQPTDGILQMSALTASDEVIIPIEPAVNAFKAITSVCMTISTIQESTNPELVVNGVLPSKVQNTKVSQLFLSKINDPQLGLYPYKNYIPERTNMQQADICQMSIIDYDKSCAAAAAFEAFATEFVQRTQQIDAQKNQVK